MTWGCNYHTHTCYCDGEDRPEDIVREAIRIGLVELGFSGHSHTAFDESYAMGPEQVKDYRAEVERLKEKYAGAISILLGIEYDYYSDESLAGWDYIIGSVHYVRKGGVYLPVDESPEDTIRAVRECYGGDPLAYAEDYFETVSKVAAKTECDIIGHFDLVTKFNDVPEVRTEGAWIDESDPRYQAAWKSALDRLIPYGIPFEINTSPWYRGRENPYPSRAILEEILARGGRITLSSDSHKKETLTRGFSRAEVLAKEVGFGSLAALTDGGYIDVPI